VTAADGRPAPDTLAAAVAARVDATRFGPVVWTAETGSTNDDAIAAARAGAGEGLVLVADHQTAGRGRQGRTWTAPPGSSLLVTVLLRPPAAVADLATMAASLALRDAVASATNGVVQPSIKWPNDLVTTGADGRERKLAGILAEADWPARSPAAAGWSPPPPGERVAVAVGMGLNVAWPKHLPDDLAETAVALNHLVDEPPAPDRADVLVALLLALDERYATLLGAGGPQTLLAAWRERSATLGRRVRVQLAGREIDGQAVAVDDRGHLVVTDDAGAEHALAAGDVIHLRPS
jgi:BirA family biotin operon repressor/biotin-[acetyl-CoA-carboxylase] ligase